MGRRRVPLDQRPAPVAHRRRPAPLRPPPGQKTRLTIHYETGLTGTLNLLVDGEGGSLLLDLLADVTHEEVLGGFVLLLAGDVHNLVDKSSHMALMLIDMLEESLHAAPALRHYVDHADLGSAAPLLEERCHIVGMLELFLRLFLHPVCKSVITLFLKIERHGKVEVGRPHLGDYLIIDRIL